MGQAANAGGQAGRPRGWLGRAIGWIMAAYNRPENLWTVELATPRPGEALLEVGCGPGLALMAAAGRGARCVGLDHSPACWPRRGGATDCPSSAAA